ncbi:DNA-binding transcriptional regulator, CsgD family [Roseovarius lutimaris]|uniref:DNA-binding transcriptional regulator, CsgD family n=1 Tax=Roseovarius lutimaris TaxID=1005928 RepID=A0A1I5E0C8_9RHOB|nr:LuxR C-terminal-related transcriptional regulator [Roseovarius lutimaris]SFO04867.1 DNA-binding transcriptional regulator, CsgD family [Roseovarius lutimaris]
MKQDWSEDVAGLIETLETPEFPKSLSKTLKNIVDFDYTVIFGYLNASRPLALFNDFPDDRRRLHVDEYLEGPYLLDPFFLASTGRVEPGLWRLSEIAPDRFYQGEYFRNYYAQTGLAEEVGYLIDVQENLSIVVSLMRRIKRFSKAEIKTLNGIRPIVDAACRRNWTDAEKGIESRAPILEAKVEHAFRSIGEGVLTPREREVVERTLRGHSADAIGKLLGISSGTVRIHRRNIYSKLRINTQGELFSAFIAAITDGQPVPTET